MCWTIGQHGSSLSPLADRASFQMFWIWKSQPLSCLSVLCVRVVPVSLSLCSYLSSRRVNGVLEFGLCVLCSLSSFQVFMVEKRSYGSGSVWQLLEVTQLPVGSCS